jgi:hypothetical protein
MIIKTPFLLTLILTLAFISCNKGTPSGFWKNYKTHLIKKNISDQGPYGGYSAIYWKDKKPEAFNSSNILDFARKNGWSLVDSLEFNQDQTNKWTYNDKPIFPLTSKGFSESILNDAMVEYFPRWFGGQIEVYKFKTGWVTIQPGTDSSIDDNGFVLINKDKTEIAVYHLWGN